MKRIAVLSALLTLFMGYALADNVTFEAKAPNAVAVGQRFNIQYVLNTQGTDLRVNVPSNLSVLAGPYTSVSSESSWVNGKTSQNYTATYTFVAKADQEGTISIPAAQISVGGKAVQSNPLSIKVVAASGAIPSTPSNSASTTTPNTAAKNKDDGRAAESNLLFLRSTLSKTKVYEQEALLYTVKVYSRYTNFQPSDMPNPVFTGFLSQQLPLPANQTGTQETVNGRIYIVYTLRQDLLFPQRSGTLKIDPVSTDFIVQERVNNNSNDPFANFFGGGVRNVKTTAKTGTLKLEVLPLPSPKPASFSGGLGDFEFTSSLNKTSLKVNEPLTLKMTIKGKGNLKILQTLKPQFPSDFEVYDPKITSKIDNTPEGAQGSINYECLAIPRHAGSFSIPPMSFSYFDLSTKQYKTLSTPLYKIEVAKGIMDSTANTVNQVFGPVAGSQEDIKVLGQDIQYIHTSNLTLSPQGGRFFNSLNYWLWILIALLIALTCFIILKKQIKESQDLAKMKNKKANKMVQRRLKAANTFLKANQREPFYEEIMKAMLNYLSDKLALPTSELTKDSAESILLKHQAKEAEVKEFMDIFHACEFARYSPGTGTDELSKIYKQTESVIGRIDGQIKKQK